MKTAEAGITPRAEAAAAPERAQESRAPESAADPHPVFAIIAGVSFCHCLNDLIQSLLPGDLPDPEGQLRRSISARSG